MARVPSSRSAVAMLASGLWAVCPVFSQGAAIVNVNNSGNETLHEISVNPGDDFLIDLRFAPGTGCGLVTMNFRASAAGVLEVMDGAWLSPWGGSIPVGGADPVSAGFGGSVPLGSQGAGPHLATMRLGVHENAAAGTYAINVENIVGASCVICTDIIVGEPGPDFVVRVLPEPGASLLVCSAAGLLVLRRR